MNLIRARELAAALGQWAAGDGAAEPEAPEATRWAMRTAGELVSELTDLERTADWDRPGHGPDHPLAFARDLALFRKHLRRCDGPLAAVAASYLHLLACLARAGGSPVQIAQAVAEAIAVYDDAREHMQRRGLQ